MTRTPLVTGRRSDASTAVPLADRPRAVTLNEQVIAVLLGGAAMLLVELRFEHREALGESWHAWLPLGYREPDAVPATEYLARAPWSRPAP